VPLLGASVQGLASIFSPSGLADLVSTSVGAQERDPEGVVSVIGIASMAGQTAEAGSAGLYTFVFLLAYLNVFLFIFNLVPLPPSTEDTSRCSASRRSATWCGPAGSGAGLRRRPPRDHRGGAAGDRRAAPGGRHLDLAGHQRPPPAVRSLATWCARRRSAVEQQLTAAVRPGVRAPGATGQR
jgi:hypothetical protein